MTVKMFLSSQNAPTEIGQFLIYLRMSFLETERLIINIAFVNTEFVFQQVHYQAIQYPGPLLEPDL